MNKIYKGDCLIEMNKIEDKSVDLILTDLPYGNGKTACKWDIIIPFNKLWEQYKRVIKDNGVIVLTASQPFTSMLIMSNLAMFKYCAVFEKTKATNYLQAKYQLMKAHEDICIFYNKKGKYNPIMTKGEPYAKTIRTNNKKDCVYMQDSRPIGHTIFNKTGDRYPRSVIKFKSQSGQGQLHPTQKPIALFEYLIKTYSNEGDVVLDNCAGSFTTAIACLNTNRKYICIEKEEKYYEIGKKRIEEHIIKNKSVK